MAKIVDLNKRRQKRDLEDKALWRCSDCKQQEYLLATDGTVICMTCREAVDDLRVQRLDEE